MSGKIKCCDWAMVPEEPDDDDDNDDDTGQHPQPNSTLPSRITATTQSSRTSSTIAPTSNGDAGRGNGRAGAGRSDESDSLDSD